MTATGQIATTTAAPSGGPLAGHVAAAPRCRRESGSVGADGRCAGEPLSLAGAPSAATTRVDHAPTPVSGSRRIVPFSADQCGSLPVAIPAGHGRAVGARERRRPQGVPGNRGGRGVSVLGRPEGLLLASRREALQPVLLLGSERPALLPPPRTASAPAGRPGLPAVPAGTAHLCEASALPPLTADRRRPAQPFQPGMPAP